MGCGSCGTGKPTGCKSNGYCISGGCNKLNVFDWLANMDDQVTAKNELLEVRFKNGRKDFFRNHESLELFIGDTVVVDVPHGYHIGYVSMQGDLVPLQMAKKKRKDEEARPIYRKATDADLEKWKQVQAREESIMYRTRKIIRRLSLEMKLTDVEFQADGSKATFFYSADERVDFRELIKVLAAEFHIRVDMRQISVRQEAARIGGLGDCGRELCCSTWLTDFKNVSTTAARYQNLSLNPKKLAGQCGRLKCCLNYELDTYKDALQDIPQLEKPLLTKRGPARLQKTDIFRKIMWFEYEDDTGWYAVDVTRVHEILEMNSSGLKPESLVLSSVEKNQESDGSFFE
ncbi:MAG: regulatory iron-sulfur-containing complex subunit RicT [Bacteroidota bacterium]